MSLIGNLELTEEIKIRFLELQLLKGKFDNIIYSDFSSNTTDYHRWEVYTNLKLTDDNLLGFHVANKNGNQYTLTLIPKRDKHYKLSDPVYDIANKYLGSDNLYTYNRYFYYTLLSLKDYWDYIPKHKFEYYKKTIRVKNYNFSNYLK